MDVLILGGGASGMMAALAAAERGAQVTLVERQARLGRKLLATGNGRCNLSNLRAAPGRYHGAEPDFCRPALSAFGPEKTLAYFRRLGLVTVAEPSGRLYPFSNQANSVLDVLRFALEAAGVQVCTGCEAIRLWPRRTGFLLKTTGGDFEAARLIVAAGGAAGGKLGGTTAGYEILERLGHRRTALYPALVQLVTQGAAARALKGVRAEGRIAALRGGKILAERTGEIQFTDYGVSGPAVFDISRAVSTGGPGLTLQMDLMPQLGEKELLELLRQRRAQLPERTAADLLTGTVHNRLGRVLVKTAGISESISLEILSDAQLTAVAKTVKNFTLTCAGTQGMDCAQVTAGGIETCDFDPMTLESHRVPGVFACGEVLDVDGDCGGFNLQWAWSSGRLAGLSAAGEEGRA